jgi:hypothetical protein
MNALDEWDRALAAELLDLAEQLRARRTLLSDRAAPDNVNLDLAEAVRLVEGVAERLLMRSGRRA